MPTGELGSLSWTGTTRVTLPALAKVNVIGTDVPEKRTSLRCRRSTPSVLVTPSESD